MRSIFRLAFVAAALVVPGSIPSLAGRAQTGDGQNGSPAPATSHAVEGGGQGETTAPRAASDVRTEKQKALARQTERLFDMATELKMQVDKTNRNILSIKVVHEAEEIELLAKGIKEQARK